MRLRTTIPCYYLYYFNSLGPFQLRFCTFKPVQTSVEVVSRASCSVTLTLSKVRLCLFVSVTSKLDSIPGFLGNPEKNLPALHNSLCPLLESSHSCRKAEQLFAASWHTLLPGVGGTKNTALQLTCPGEGGTGRANNSGAECLMSHQTCSGGEGSAFLMKSREPAFGFISP